MIFTYALADAIKAGNKTVTRRPVARCKGYEPGDLIPVSRGYHVSQFSVRVVSCEREDGFVVTWDFDDAEGRREGFEDGRRFAVAWRDIYGPDPVDVYRIESERVTP